MALNRIKDFPHMLNSLKNKKDSYLDKEIESEDIHIWVCNECGDEWRENISEKFHYNNCPDCEERYDVSLEDCSFGGNKRRLCKEDNCYVCYMRSFASSIKAYQWSKDNIGRARDTFKSTNKRILLDCECGHTYEITPDKSTKGRSCPYCSNPPQKLCNEEDCQNCYNRSFASHERSIFWDYKGNGNITPRQVFKGSSSYKYHFIHDCGHKFEKTLNALTAQETFCPFCAGKRLCKEVNCVMRFNKSFASSPKSEYWDEKRNCCKARDVFLSSSEKYHFTCNICKHELYIRLDSISAGKWCKYCTNNAFCLRDNCEFCFNRSFASHKKVKYWVYEKNKNINPRNILMGAKEKCWFNCKHHGHFKISLESVKRGSWCSLCLFKGETKLYEYLKGTYDDVVYQAAFPWCKSKITNLPLKFDFFIPSLNMIIELDGVFHFKTNEYFKSDPDDIRKRDIFKMKCALDNELSMIRILQMDVFYDKNNWKDKLERELCRNDICGASFISTDNCYDDHIADISKYYDVVLGSC